jgi:hypothetical protein
MAIYLYTEPGGTVPLSTDGTNPFTITFDGLRGGSISKKLYVRNSETDRYYSDITVSINDTGVPSRSDGTDEFRWRLYEGEHHPPIETWETIVPGTAITLSNNIGTYIKGDISTYLPFWVRVEIPPDRRVQVIDQIYLRLAATEYLI